LDNYEDLRLELAVASKSR